jgi:hypothetical protein
VGLLALAGVVAPTASPVRSDPAPVERAAPGAVPDPSPAPEAAHTDVLASVAPVEVPAGEFHSTTPPEVLPAAVSPPERPAPSPPTPPAAGPTTPDPAPSPPPGEPPASAPPPTPPAPTGPLFSARGQLLLPALLGLTQAEMQAGCGAPSSQGVDALVFELPPEARVAGAPVRLSGSDLLGLHNLDAAFYSESCEVVGRLAGPAADEAGPLPGRTHFVVVTDRLGIATSVELSVG